MPFLIGILILLSPAVLAEHEPRWNGKPAAISLTYDDAVDSHLDYVIPSLAKHHFQATFYITMNAPAFSRRLDEWKRASKHGHELGNHTLFHPCDATEPGRQWVTKDNDLSRWTVARFIQNQHIGNTLLSVIDGQKTRSFALPCGNSEAGGISFRSELVPLFSAVRGTQIGINTYTNFTPYNLKLIDATNMRLNEITPTLNSIKDGYAIFMFHGVGGDHALNTHKNVHTQLLNAIALRQHEFWVAPVAKVAAFMRAKQSLRF